MRQPDYLTNPAGKRITSGMTSTPFPRPARLVTLESHAGTYELVERRGRWAVSGHMHPAVAVVRGPIIPVNYLTWVDGPDCSTFEVSAGELR